MADTTLTTLAEFDAEIVRVEERLEDAQGESMHCGDDDCRCHHYSDLSDELDWLREQRLAVAK